VQISRYMYKISVPNSNFRTFQDKFQNFRNFRTMPCSTHCLQNVECPHSTVPSSTALLISTSLFHTCSFHICITVLRFSTLTCFPFLLQFSILALSVPPKMVAVHSRAGVKLTANTPDLYFKTYIVLVSLTTVSASVIIALRSSDTTETYLTSVHHMYLPCKTHCQPNALECIMPCYTRTIHC